MRKAVLILAPLALATLAGCAGAKSNTAKLVQAPPSCQPMTFPIYFRTDSDALTDQAVKAIHATAGQAKDCRVAAVAVTGLADASGPADKSMELSKRRAETVAKALAAEGWPAPAIEAAGNTGATGPGGAAAPMRRRTEVTVTFAH